MNKDKIVGRINKLLDEYENLRKKAYYDDLSDLNNDILVTEIATRILATIGALAEKDSAYMIQARPTNPDGYLRPARLPNLVAVLKALKVDIENDYLWHINEIIHADVFADFIEMARYLLEEGYKDPSAVLVGGVLEEHLRKLCIKNSIAIKNSSSGESIFKKVSAMNDELKRAEIYGNLEHKNIIAWLELRNKASHAKYEEYSKEQAKIMLVGVLDFITKFPA